MRLIDTSAYLTRLHSVDYYIWILRTRFATNIVFLSIGMHEPESTHDLLFWLEKMDRVFFSSQSQHQETKERRKQHKDEQQEIKLHIVSAVFQWSIDCRRLRAKHNKDWAWIPTKETYKDDSPSFISSNSFFNNQCWEKSSSNWFFSCSDSVPSSNICVRWSIAVFSRWTLTSYAEI